MTFRATDILLNQSVQVVETDIPNFVSWFRLKDGTIVGLTYIPQQETIAWHQHKIGGDYSYNSTREGDPTGNLATDKSHAVVLDMCTIPSSTRDQLWMLVRELFLFQILQQIHLLPAILLDLYYLQIAVMAF